MAKRRKSRFKTLALLTICGLMLVAFFTVFISQRIRLEKLNAQMDELNQQLDELAIEEQRLELLRSYVQSGQFARDYARDRLGYLEPDEIIFQIE